MGVLVLSLIADWASWVHRRVETIRVEDPATYRRSVSVDLTLPIGTPTPLQSTGGIPLYPVPLALLRKRRLRRFDLCDEGGRALPLMTARKNGAVAAGVLQAAAGVFAEDKVAEEHRNELPSEVLDDIWAIATAAPTEADRIWEALGVVRDDGDAAATAWRSSLSANERFMALARDLSRNFIVVVPLEINPGQRRVLKFAYDEPQRARERVGFMGRRLRRDRHEKLPEPGPEGVGIVTIRAQSSQIDTEKTEVEPQPLRGVTITLSFADGQEQNLETDDRGQAITQLAAGRYVAQAHTPRGFAMRSAPRQEVEITPDRPATVSFNFLRIRALGMEPGLDEPVSPGGSDPFVVVVPSLGQAGSYHLEIEAPEGLQVTAARLGELPAYVIPTENGNNKDLKSDFETGNLQRAHLYLAGVRQGQSGRAVFYLRPRPETIVRPAALTGCITSIAILIVCLRLDGIGPNISAVGTLLLLIPGGLSAYVARHREPITTTARLFRLRIAALTCGLWAFLSTLLLVLGRDWPLNRAKNAFAPPDGWGLVRPGLWLIFALSLGSVVYLAKAWRGATHPAEQHNIASDTASSISDTR
jgi:prealbumin domain-containing protein